MVPPGSRQAEGGTRWTSSHPSFAERYVRAHKLAESLRNGSAPPAPTARPDGSPRPPGTTHSLR